MFLYKSKVIHEIQTKELYMIFSNISIGTSCRIQDGRSESILYNSTADSLQAVPGTERSFAISGTPPQASGLSALNNTPAV